MPADAPRTTGDAAPDKVKVPAVVIAATLTVPVRVGLADKTRDPVPVEVVTPVPPLATDRTPPRVSVPEVVTGPPVKVNPVVDPDTLTEVTVPRLDRVVHPGVAPTPEDVRTWPEVPTDPLRDKGEAVPTKLRVPVIAALAVLTVPVRVGLADKTTEPVPVEVATPVPPLATPRVPPRVKVPVVVMGLPVNVSPVVPPDAATDVTVPTLAQLGVAPAPPDSKA